MIHAGFRMSRAAVVLGMALLIVFPCWTRQLQAEPVPPYEMVRAISFLQEQIAQGNPTALQDLRSAERVVAAALAGVANDAWQLQRNRDAILRFVATGGSPRILQRLLDGKTFDPKQMAAALGVLAFAVGRSDMAWEQLRDVDHRSLAPTLAGPIALIKAVSISRSDAQKSLALLDDARLLSPGTLVEESALRVTVELAAKIKDLDRVEAAISRYVRRFTNSLYYPAVVPYLARHLAIHDYFADETREQWLMEVVGKLEPRRRQQLMAQTALLAIRNGAISTASSAARIASENASPEDAITGRMQTYQGAALVATDRIGYAVDLLNRVDRSSLADMDRKLLVVAKALGDYILSPPVFPETALEPEPAETGLAENRAAQETLVRAQATIERVDQMLGRL